MTLITAPITAVTVFPDRARITRRGKAQLAAGEHRVSVGPLPLGLVRESVRVAGDGPATVLGVDVVTRRQATTGDSEVAELEERLRAIDDSLAALDDADAVAAARERFIARITTRSAGRFSTGEAAGDMAAASSFADDVDAQLTEVKVGTRRRGRERVLLRGEREAAQRRLADLRGRRSPDQLFAQLTLDVAQEGELELELSYVTTGAAWRSSYDLRLTGDRVNLSWYGLITQHTGEDWPECELRLSTARPSGVLEVPELDPWYLDRVRPIQPVARHDTAMPMMAAAAPASAPGGGAGLMRAAKVEQAVAVAEQGPVAATYTPSRPVAVPADGTAHRTVVATFDLEARLDHVTAPVASADAIMRATVRNTSTHTLPRAEASLFHEGDFVGSAAVEPWAPQEERELALGVDDRVRVERELVKRSATKATLGSARRIDAEYEITVANHGPRAIHLTVLDQLPVSRDAEISVKETVTKPDPAQRDELGVVTWKTELEPFASAKFQLGFRVESAKGVQLAGWRD